MLNIGRMAPGSHSYYLGIVADGAEDYYLAHGEEPGRWLGGGAARLELAGRVEADELRAVLSGDDPNGGCLARHPARRIPGFDLTFRAPKSVSLLWRLAEGDVAAKVTAAHDTAVDAAIGYLERAAGYTRRGAGGVERVESGGFVAAAFRHRTSRANDPLLHIHVLVANLAEALDDGKWRTLDSRALFVHARTAGFLYQAQLRFELTRTLGVAWAEVTNGYSELVGVPRGWIEHFSQRRAEIVERMRTRGETSAKAAQVATLATRHTKETPASEAQLRSDWSSRARRLGIDPSWTIRLLGATTPMRADVGGLYEELVERETLTARASTFTRSDVVRAIAERLPTGAPSDYIEQIADAIVAHDPGRVIPLGNVHGRLTHCEIIRTSDGAVVPADQDEPRYTTRGLLLTEQRAIGRAVERRGAGVAGVAPGHVETALLTRRLTREQAAMVRRIARSGAGVEIVVGKAGTGKTYALDAARDAWTAAGIPVAGAALAARAALELEDSSGIPSTTIARLLHQAEGHTGRSPFLPGSVLIVDEAGMVGTRTLARVLDHAERSDMKVILVGDHRQLPEIDAGGLFRALAARLPIIELTDNRRQRERWEAKALDQLRHGNTSAAIATYRSRNRLIVADTAEAVRAQLVDDWWQVHQQADGSLAVMVALRRSDVDDLNTRARRQMAAAGRINGPTIDSDGHVFQAGDRIVCLRNDQRLGVVNGTRGTVTHVDPARRKLYVTDDAGAELLIPGRYLDAGHVTHGYAITGHKAQGLTVDHTFVLGSEELYREWGYVAMSRGRKTNRLYLCRTEPADDLHEHITRPHVDTVMNLDARLRRSRAQQAASEQLSVRRHTSIADGNETLRRSRRR